MDFNAKQMREDALIKDGRYKYIVLDAREKRSSNGNDMLNLKLSLEVNGRRVVQFDSLILIPKMFWKVEHFCKSAGIPEKLDEGRLMAQDCLNKEGYLDLCQKVDQQTGELGNQVKDYVKPEDLSTPTPADVAAFDDDIKR